MIFTVASTPPLDSGPDGTHVSTLQPEALQRDHASHLQRIGRRIGGHDEGCIHHMIVMPAFEADKHRLPCGPWRISGRSPAI